VTLATGPACLECMRVGVGEVSRACFVGWRGDCDPVRFRLDSAGGEGVGVAGGGCGGGGKFAARVSSLRFSCTVCSLLRSPPVCAERLFIVSLISVTVAAKAATSALVSSRNVRNIVCKGCCCWRVSWMNFSQDSSVVRASV
jgi:hypothetical protein